MKTLSVLAIFMLCGCNNLKNEEKVPAPHHAAGTIDNAYCEKINRGLISEDTMKGSPGRYAMSSVNGVHVHITYHSPGVKGRIIWGGLVPYDRVWVTGAHQCTTIDFDKPVVIRGKTLNAGTYALFTIPGKDKWQVILNKNINQHLADEYDAKDDVLRFDVTPVENTATPRLTFEVKKVDASQGEVVMMWDKLKFSFQFTAS